MGFMVPRHAESRPRKILTKTLNRLGRFISRLGRLISHFVEDLEAYGVRTAFRSSGVLVVESYVRTRWSWGKQMLVTTLARAEKQARSMLPMPSRPSHSVHRTCGSRPCSVIEVVLETEVTLEHEGQN